jgi:hypothetical protein
MHEKEKNRRKNKEKLETGEVYLIDSLNYVANYYEFLCAGIVLDDLDDKLMRNTIRSILVSFHDSFFVHIDDARRGYDGAVVNEKVYEHLGTVSERYRLPTDGQSPYTDHR